VGELRGHLPDRGELLLGPYLLLEALDVRQVLEHEQVPRAHRVARGEGRDRDAELDEGAVGTTVGDLEAGQAPRGAGLDRVGLEEPGAEHLAHVPAPRVLRGPAQDRLAERVHVQDVAGRVAGEQPAVDAVDDDLVQLLEVGHLAFRLLELLPRVAQVLRDVGADEADGAAGDGRDERGVDDDPRGQEGDVGEALGWDEAQAEGEEQGRVEHARERGQHHAALAVEEDAPGQHGERVEQDEARADAAVYVDEAGDDQEVAHHLAIDLERGHGQEAHRERVEEGQDVDRDDQEVEGVDREERLRDRLHVGGDQEEGRDHDEPEEHQPLEPRLQAPVHGPSQDAPALLHRGGESPIPGPSRRRRAKPAVSSAC
jgi:hypothetical protein